MKLSSGGAVDAPGHLARVDGGAGGHHPGTPGARIPRHQQPDTEVMLAGNWKTARMVAHYSAGATAERGAVRKYL